MITGLRKVGECYSGVLYKSQEGVFKFPRVIRHIGLATPRALDIMFKDPKLMETVDRELVLKGTAPMGRLFEAGLTFETFYGRGEWTCIGIYFTHRIIQPQITVINGQRTAVLDMAQPEDPAFVRTLKKEARIYKKAKNIIYSLDPEGREIFFGITGIATSGLEPLSKNLYSALLARIDNKYGLENLAAINVLQDEGLIEREESGAEGAVLTISSGMLRREPNRAYPWELQINPSNISN